MLEDGIPWHLGGLEGAWQRRSKSKTAGVGIGTKVSFLLSPASHAELGRMPSERRESKRGSRGRQTAVYPSAVPPTPRPWPGRWGAGSCRGPRSLRAEETNLRFGQEHNHPFWLPTQGVEKAGSIFSLLGPLWGPPQPSPPFLLVQVTPSRPLGKKRRGLGREQAGRLGLHW